MSASETPQKITRRDFLAFLGRGALAVAGSSMLPSLAGCTRVPTMPPHTRIRGLVPSRADELTLADGLSYRVLLRWEEELREGLRFGFNNDFLALLPRNESPDEAYLWVNHEYLSQPLIHRFRYDPTSRAQYERELTEVGGSLVHLRKTPSGWQVVTGSDVHQRYDARSPIPFAWPVPIHGSQTATGTLGNCAGGYTPWGTFLTCEENYDQFYGERLDDGSVSASEFGWERFDARPPEHYGWVIEVDPQTHSCQKLVALGRCAHECATVLPLPDGRCVVYTGDDANDQFIYKFVSARPGELTEGTLYVADTNKGQWLPLVWADQPLLRDHFRDQTEVLVYLRKAAKLLGATPQDRPEDIEIDPRTGQVFISCTMNLPRGNVHGHLLRIDELGDPTGDRFRAEVFLTGGPETGFACPDNLAFDPRGGLWFTSDIPGRSIGAGAYQGLGNNGLFYVPTEGTQAGTVIPMAYAPVAAELTGPLFVDGGRTLLLSVQHPGETSESLDQLTSHWPEGGTAYPRPAVVVITGPLLESLASV